MICICPKLIQMLPYSSVSSTMVRKNENKVHTLYIHVKKTQQKKPHNLNIQCKYEYSKDRYFS